MKHTVTRFEMNIYDWNFWTADVVTKFAAWLKDNGETRVDKKSKTFQNALMLGLAYQYHLRLFNAIDERGFRV